MVTVAKRWHVTVHARERYAQRVGDGQLYARLDHAGRLGRKQRRRLEDGLSPSHRQRLRAGHPWIYLLDDTQRGAADPLRGVVFACRDDGDRLVVVTCLVLFA